MSSSTRRTPLGVKCLAVGRTFDRVLVAIYSDGSASQLQAVIARILCNTDAIDQHPRLTVTDRHVGTVHYDTERGFVFFCVTDESYPQRAAFKCIAAVRSDFLRQFGDIAEKSAADGLSSAARDLMAGICSTFGDAASIERTVGISRQVQEVTEIMNGSINELLASQDDLQVLEDKTDALASQAQRFQRNAH
eukprot:1669432-Prymnesium_polylepis.1